MKWLRGFGLAALTALMVMAGLISLAGSGYESDSSPYGSHAGAPTGPKSASTE
jgi:hypothetical protein